MWTDVKGKKHLEVIVTESNFREVIEDAIMFAAQRYTVSNFTTVVESLDKLAFFVRSSINPSESPYDYVFIHRPLGVESRDAAIVDLMKFIDDNNVPTQVAITSDCILGSSVTDKFSIFNCYAGIADISTPKKYLTDTVEDILCSNMLCLERCKSELVELLGKMNRIMPVQFVDTDCDNGVYNFSDVKIDETDHRVYIELAMWHDNLPDHKAEPLDDGRGRKILPAFTASCESCEKNINYEKCEGHNNFELSDNQFKQYFEDGRIGCPAYKRKENE